MEKNVLSQKEKVLRALKSGPRSSKQLEHNFHLPKVSPLIAKLRSEGYHITNGPYTNSAGRVTRKYALV